MHPPATPHLIVNVETTPATTPDDNMVAVVHASLAARHRLPAEHLVDQGDPSAQELRDCQRDDPVALIGPVADDPSGQAGPGKALPRRTFESMGIAAWSLARRATRAISGCRKPRFPGSGGMPVSRVRIARHVRTIPDVPASKRSRASSAYRPAISMKPCRPRARFKSPRRAAGNMRPARR